jgi:hypothetical protein
MRMIVRVKRLLSSSSVRVALVVGVLAVVLAATAGTAAAKCTSVYCGSYHGHTDSATDPVGHTSGGGPFGFVVGSKGVVSVTAQVSWVCFSGDPNAPYTSEPYHFDRTFKAAPLKKKGQVSVDKHFGDLSMGLVGHIKKGKFTGTFSLGLLSGTVGCGTAPLPATAKKKKN